MSQWRFFFILASSKLTAVNIFLKDHFGSSSSSQIITVPQDPAPQYWFLKHFIDIDLPGVLGTGDGCKGDDAGVQGVDGEVVVVRIHLPAPRIPAMLSSIQITPT